MQTQEASQERRVATQDKLKTLLQARNETLALYSQLAGLRPFKPDQEVQLLLQEFCEALVDYTASAHFQLYRFLDEGTERRANIKSIAKQFYPRIVETTRQILSFNEKYDCADHCNNLSELDPDLSELGEVIADRISAEDRIIATFSPAT